MTYSHCGCALWIVAIKVVPAQKDNENEAKDARLDHDECEEDRRQPPRTQESSEE